MTSPPMGLRASEPGEEQLEKIIKPLLRKKGILRRRSVEKQIFKSILYMPYDVVEFEYELAGGEEGTGRTAVNLVLAGSAEDLRELTLCLKPGLALEASRASGLGGDARLLKPRIRGLAVLKKLADARAEVEGFRSKAGAALADARRKLMLPQYRLISLFFPTPSIQAVMAERTYADLYARVEAFVRELNSRLGLDEGAELTALRPLSQEGPIFFPSLVVGLSGPEGDRLIVLDVSGREPKLDVEATYLCSTKPELREELRRAASA